MAEKHISQEKVNKKKGVKKQKFKAWVKSWMTVSWAKRFAYQVVSFLVSVAMIAGVTIYAFNATYDEKVLNLVDDFTLVARTGAYKTLGNSLESVEAAIENNAKIMQIDVRERPNGTIVIAQDLIKTNFDGVEISKVFELVQSTDMELNLNIKEIWVLSKLYDLIVQYNMIDRVYLTGIETFQVNRVKEYCPNVKYYIDFIPSRLKIFSDDYQEKILNTIKESGAVGINCRHIFASRTLSKLLHKNGYKLSIHDVNWRFQMKRALVNSPDLIVTKYPDKIQEEINTWGE